jgi:hypothetical protein
VSKKRRFVPAEAPFDKKGINGGKKIFETVGQVELINTFAGQKGFARINPPPQPPLPTRSAGQGRRKEKNPYKRSYKLNFLLLVLILNF